jgi:hypothetical protein
MKVGEHLARLHNVKLVPFTQTRPNALEQRRIGVGYRDKGSLPKPSKIDWDNPNERTVSLREEDAPFSYTLFDDLLKNPSEESSVRLMSRLRENYPEALCFLLRSYKVEHTEPRVWKYQALE